MLVKEVMSPSVKVIHFDRTVKEAAKMMEESNCGSLPVEKGDKMIGMITDRDIALRVVGEGKDPAKTLVSEVMSEGISYCFEEDEIDIVIDKMTKQHHGRVPVINENKRLVGIVSLAGIGRRGNNPKISHKIMTGLSSF
jgi:CBS domain-containing protein